MSYSTPAPAVTVGRPVTGESAHVGLAKTGREHIVAGLDNVRSATVIPPSTLRLVEELHQRHRSDHRHRVARRDQLIPYTTPELGHGELEQNGARVVLGVPPVPLSE